MSCHNLETWPKKWEQMEPGTEDWLYLKQPSWSDHQWPMWRWLSRADRAAAALAPSFCLQSSRPLVASGRESWTDTYTLPNSSTPEISKLSFLPTWLFIGFWAASSWTPLFFVLAYPEGKMWYIYTICRWIKKKNYAALDSFFFFLPSDLSFTTLCTECWYQNKMSFNHIPWKFTLLFWTPAQ